MKNKIVKYFFDHKTGGCKAYECYINKNKEENHGSIKSFYHNGEILFEGYYIFGRYIGAMKRYHKNNKREYLWNRISGRKEGIQIDFNYEK